jgi:acetoin utilization protein AcuC
LDIDAHHGDGTEALLAENPQVLTFSVHDSSIFPGTGFHDDPGNHVFNRPLAPRSGDHELLDAVADFITTADSFAPDMLLMAMGADGLDGDPLSTLQYSFEGLAEAVRTVRQHFPDTPLLLGGAGGYRPDDATPQAWVRMIIAAATA